MNIHGYEQIFKIRKFYHTTQIEKIIYQIRQEEKISIASKPAVNHVSDNTTKQKYKLRLTLLYI